MTAKTSCSTEFYGSSYSVSHKQIASMKIGIIGTGGVGQVLGTRLAQAGRSVCYGSRDIHSTKAQDLVKKHGAAVKPVKEAVEFADCVILAVPGMRDAAAVSLLAESLGPGVAGKIVIDATNPLTPYPDLEVLWNGTSGGELLQAGLPDGALVYKAFNTIGIPMMIDPDALKSPVSMLFAGAAGPAKDDVAAVIRDVGFDPVYVGPIRYARNLEAIAELWIHLAVPPAGFTQENFGMKFAFNVARSPPQ